MNPHLVRWVGIVVLLVGAVALAGGMFGPGGVILALFVIVAALFGLRKGRRIRAASAPPEDPGS